MIRYLGMRHIALRVSDMDRSARFYATAFGMRRWGPPKRGGTLIPLVSPNLRDQISLSSAQSSGETDRHLGKPGEQGGIDHFGFIVAPGTSLDELKEHLESCGARYLRRVDVHRYAPSLFFEDPDGYVFQVTRFPWFARLYIALLPLLNMFRERPDE